MEPIVSLLKICAVFDPEAYEATERDSVLQAIRERLTVVFESIATVLAASLAEQGWGVDTRNPGFLIHPADRLEIRAPWHLLRDFPPEEILQELTAIAVKIRSGSDTSICISGSSTSYRATHPVGDIDFCEYVDHTLPKAEDRTFIRTIQKAASLQDDSLICVRIAMSSPAVADSSRPWTLSPDQDPDLLSKAVKTTEGKCDFIGTFGKEDVVEITKLVLFLDPASPDAGAAERSFPPQEAPISPEGGWVPRQIANPLTLGAYVRWLLERLQDLPERDLAKAAKRALSLTRLAALESLSERIIQLLTEKKLTTASALESRLRLWERMDRMSGDPLVSPFLPLLSETIHKLADDLNEPRLAFPASGLNTLWREEARAYLSTRWETGLKARNDLQAILDEIVGHFSEDAT